MQSPGFRVACFNAQEMGGMVKWAISRLAGG
jgi:hypothetical protein